jgi:Peptidase A4 family/Putative Ig domain
MKRRRRDLGGGALVVLAVVVAGLGVPSAGAHPSPGSGLRQDVFRPPVPSALVSVRLPFRAGSAALMEARRRMWVAAARPPRPVITSIDVTPTVVSGRGGSVLVRVEVAHAKWCAFHGQRVAFAVLRLHRTVGCSFGRARVRMPVGANPYLRQVTLHFAVTATDGHSRRARSSLAVIQQARQAPAPPSPQTGSLAVATAGLPGATAGSAYSATLSARGGKPPYAWTIASGSLPPGLLLSPAGVIAGTASSPGVFTFGVAVADSQLHFAQAVLTISVAAPQIPTSTSANWSGYFLSGGTYRGVSGTFNVPALYSSPNDTVTGEWVGIDGYGPSEPSLIQAGVAEPYFAGTNQFAVFAWVEILPAPAVPLSLPVAPGDRVTVAVAQVGAGVWSVSIKNETTGQGWSANLSYSGPGLSADWILEAPTLASTNTIQTIGNFSPVTFSHLAIDPDPPPGSLTRVVMVQNGQAVATPSAITPSGFTIAYGGATPPAP